jgi:hypothetical protein
MRDDDSHTSASESQRYTEAYSASTAGDHRQAAGKPRARVFGAGIVH